MFLYQPTRPGYALLLSGWRVEGDPARIVKGGAWVLPFLRQARFLPLAPPDVEVAITEGSFDDQGVELLIHGKVSYRVADVPKAVDKYAEHPERMEKDVRTLFEAKLAQVAGTMPVEQIALRGRKTFAEAVMSEAEEEMGRMGLVCEGLAIPDLRDKENYIEHFASQKKAAMAGVAMFTRMRNDKQTWMEIGSLFQEGAELPALPDGRTVDQALDDSRLSLQAFAEANGGD